MKDKNQGKALKCSLLGCNMGRQIVPGVSQDCNSFFFTKDKYLRSIVMTFGSTVPSFMTKLLYFIHECKSLY